MLGTIAIVGLHLFSLHSPSEYPTGEEKIVCKTELTRCQRVPVKKRFNNNNAGLYVMTTTGATFGVLNNSYGDLSLYAGYTHTWDWFSVTFGAATGYDRYQAPIRPFVMPSVKIGPVRISGGPSLGDEYTGLLHISLEYKF
jgi:hypothetical protein